DRNDTLACCDTSIICHDLHLNRGFVPSPGNHPILRLELLHDWEEHEWEYYLDFSSRPTQITSQRYLHVRHTKAPLLHGVRAPLATTKACESRVSSEAIPAASIERSDSIPPRHTWPRGGARDLAVFRIECQIVAPQPGCRECL
ncbi:hypothetical protein J1614_004668, partial [Plenodomus biglobosus]